MSYLSRKFSSQKNMVIKEDKLQRFLYLLIVCALISSKNAHADQAEWVRTNLNISDNNFTCMAIDPQRPDTLYLIRVKDIFTESILNQAFKYSLCVTPGDT